MNRKLSQLFNGIIFHFVSIGSNISRGKNITQDAFYWGNFLMVVYINYLCNLIKFLMADFFFEKKKFPRAIEKILNYYVISIYQNFNTWIYFYNFYLLNRKAHRWIIMSRVRNFLTWIFRFCEDKVMSSYHFSQPFYIDSTKIKITTIKMSWWH